MTDADLQRLRGLCEAATQPAPWRVSVQDADAFVMDAKNIWVAHCGPSLGAAVSER
jgi:hypothetical protein